MEQTTKIINDLNNLLLNMSAGLVPINLSKNEREILAKEFGPNWFDELGYKEPEYQRPV